MNISFIKRQVKHHLQQQPAFVQKLFSNASFNSAHYQYIARAVALGLFMACMPLPFHFIIAAILAIPLRANVLLTAALVWVNNPLTMFPLFYFCYRVGLLLLDLPPQNFSFEQSWHWLLQNLISVWQPFLLGCVTVGATAGILGYVGTIVSYRFFKPNQTRLASKQSKAITKVSSRPLR